LRTLAGSLRAARVLLLVALGLLPSTMTAGCRTVGTLEESQATQAAQREAAWQPVGREVEESRAVGDFSTIYATDRLSVTLLVGATTDPAGPVVRVVGDPAHVALVRSEVNGGQLYLGLEAPRPDIPLDAVVHIVAGAPDEISVAGDVRMSATGFLGGDLAVDVSSVAELWLAGQVDELVADVSSGGALQALDLEAEAIVLDGRSGGQAKVHARTSFIADLSSGASACYEGAAASASADTSSGASFGRCRE
jgi:hypothetical protein